MRLVAKIVLLVFTLTLLFSFMTCFVASADMPSPNKLTERKINGEAEKGITGITGALLKYMNIIGCIAAVLILAVYGVKWFMATPQQKAILKEQAWSYIIGSVLVFGGATLMVWIATTFQDAFK